MSGKIEALSHSSKPALGPEFRIIAVPTVWKLETGPDDAQSICEHVASEMFGDKVIEVLEPDCSKLSEMLYSQALEDLKAQCKASGRLCDLTDPLGFVCHIGGPTWKEAGLRWVRIVRITTD